LQIPEKAGGWDWMNDAFNPKENRENRNIIKQNVD
jgi:hypothetical protein